jgi:hypothetical protein
MKVRNALMLMIAVMIAFIAPTNGSAQTSDSTKACYVPTTGNVYRIGVGSTPATCRPGHGTNLLGLTLPMFRQIDFAGTMLSLKNNNAAGFVAYLEATGNGHALKAMTNSTGPATIHAENANTGTVLWARNTSTGQALFAQATNAGAASHIENLGTSTAIFAKSAGGSTINILNTGTNGNALRAVSSATVGPAAHIESTGTTGGGAIYARNNSNAATVNIDNISTGTALRAIAASGYAFTAETSRTDNGPVAHIENKGTGYAIFAKGTAGSVIYAENTGTTGGNAINAKSASPWNTVDITNTGAGNALGVNSVGNGTAVNIFNNGTGQALFAKSSNQHNTARFENIGTGRALDVHGEGPQAAMIVENTNASGSAIYATSAGSQPSTTIHMTGGTATALQVNQNGTGAAIWASAANNSALALGTSGRAEINGNLLVIGNQNATGTKSAVVTTSAGKRLMYTEEATEVWFTDYGFGKLQDGEIFIAFDAVYAETANLNEPYHVFIQAYGTSELHVIERTPTGFRVKIAKGDPASEFSYRIVAKRMNFEKDRLERAGH